MRAIVVTRAQQNRTGLVAPSAPYPVVLVDGRISQPVTDWLRERSSYCRPDNLDRDARNSAHWLESLRQNGSSIERADQSAWLKFVSQCWTNPTSPSDRLSDPHFASIRSTVLRLHKWLAHEPYLLSFRFKTRVTHTRFGTREQLVGGPRVRMPDPYINPILPEFQTLLCAATQPLDRETGPRDNALLHWLLASGFRIGATSLLTHYEVPSTHTRLTPGPTVHVRSPTAISKTRGYSGEAFGNLLHPFVDYIGGQRQDLASIGSGNRGHAPPRPLHIRTADSRGPVFRGETRRTSWDRLNAQDRARLVDVDGSSPAVWLTQQGTPASLRTLQYAVRRAVLTTHEQFATTDFPSRVRPHDLRHTFALMTVLWWFLSSGFTVDLGDQRTAQLQVRDAVAMVQTSLGHFNETTTIHYIKQASLWLANGITVDQLAEVR